jgi:pimeloyl-ACP methyl ester carboxylesterase
VVPDLRGHGVAPQRRGDVDYIGQLEDDLADLIEQVQAQGNHDEVVLGGHSSGGGLVVRFAGGAHGAMVDRYLVMAPFLKYNAPTTRPNSGGWASVATPRIVGLTILNELGVTAFNHLPVISFAMPKVVLDGPYGMTATTSYSFRLHASFAPRSDYGGDLAKMTQPFLLIAGARDEAFEAALYEETFSEHTSSGSYVVLAGLNHIGLTTEPLAIEAVADWIGEVD